MAASRLKSERMRWTVSDPTTTANTHRIVNVNRAEAPARRVRIGSRSKAPYSRSPTRRSPPRRSGPEDVSGSPDRVQQARLSRGLELAAQVRDEHLDRVRRREGVVAPDLVEQALAGDDDALVAHQVLEQLELALGQLDRALATLDLVGVDVEAQVGHAQGR